VQGFFRGGPCQKQLKMIISALPVENILSPKSYKKFVRGFRGGPCQK
jgi:hypothetical protein